jgi:hypothetical protein
MDEINQELESIIQSALPDVPEDELPSQERVKDRVKTRNVLFIFKHYFELTVLINFCFSNLRRERKSKKASGFGGLKGMNSG